MGWDYVADILPRYDAGALVIGSRETVAGWPGNEAVGFEDEDIELDTGTVFVFDLNLLQPAVFVDGEVIKLIASFTGVGSRGVDPAAMAEALAQPVDEEDELGTFEVTDGQLVLMNADQALAGDDPEKLELPPPATAPSAPHRSIVTVPCTNGTWRISEPVTIPARFGTFDTAIALIIRRVE